ncbi:MAG TPA: hypothetical protein VNY79_11920, partial [Xanthobacteraceae bacterium]|nr:hypothetical protein [Xanthobacteraceae bacterium]
IPVGGACRCGPTLIGQVSLAVGLNDTQAVLDALKYSRLAGAHEERALARSREAPSDPIDTAIAAHDGRIANRSERQDVV